MIALKTVDLRNNFRRVSNLVNSGEKIIITRPRNENLVILSEKEFNEMEKSHRNAEYLAKIDKAMEQLARGEGQIHELIEVE